ncbi:MAG: hypothetical protein IT173_04100 [Acidobacteria bacterium]|nr:hypothetical protein [Acidobacteriota bacterium]
METLEETLNHLYPDRVIRLDDRNSIPGNEYMVYVLGHNNIAIVVGHGKRNRAAVIFDDLNRKTPAHLKALLVRIYRLFNNSGFDRFIISCGDKNAAKTIEKHLHNEIGGNSCAIPEPLMKSLTDGIRDDYALLFLNLAACSSFDGLHDLRKWRRKGLISDSTWGVLSKKLRLEELNWN